jgi:hypothetical protein
MESRMIGRIESSAVGGKLRLTYDIATSTSGRDDIGGFTPTVEIVGDRMGRGLIGCGEGRVVGKRV